MLEHSFPRMKLSGISPAEDEVAFARERGAFSLSNPIIGFKNEGKFIIIYIPSSTVSITSHNPLYITEAAGNPLYLTPDEMTDFEQKQ